METVLNAKFLPGIGFVDADTDIVAVPHLVLEATDYLMRLLPHASPDGRVEGENDWLIIHRLWEVFVRCYPDQYEPFLRSVDKMRSLNRMSKGYSKDKDMQHQMEIPERFNQLLNLFYPLQSYDTKFARRLVKELPILKAT